MGRLGGATCTVYLISALDQPGRKQMYRVSHSKVSKVILLWWGYRFQFLLIFWILWVHGIGAFMPNSSVFIFLMLRALYGSISEKTLVPNEFWFILTFRSLFWVKKQTIKNIHFYFKLKIWNKKASKNPINVGKKIENSFTLGTFKLF